MAFHLHLIELHRDLIPPNVSARLQTPARLSLQWELDWDERLSARWIRA